MPSDPWESARVVGQCPKCARELIEGWERCPECGEDVPNLPVTRVPPLVGELPTGEHVLLSTTYEVPGRSTAQALGICSAVVTIGTGIGGALRSTVQAATKGEIPRLTTLLEEGRSAVIARLIQRAREMGAHAVVGLRVDTDPLANDVVTFTAIGTAVLIASQEPAREDGGAASAELS